MAAPKRDLGGAAACPGTHGPIQGLRLGSQNRKRNMKNAINKSYLKRSTPKHEHWCRKGANKGNKIDAKTAQKTMPKQVSEHIMKII